MYKPGEVVTVLLNFSPVGMVPHERNTVEYARYDLHRSGCDGCNDYLTASRAARLAISPASFVDHIPGEGLEFLRVGFELRGPGGMWVDDVEVSTRWASRDEQRALAASAASALHAWEQQEYGPSYRFLNGYWTRYVQRHAPLQQPTGDVPLTQVVTPQAPIITPLVTRLPVVPVRRYGNDPVAEGPEIEPRPEPAARAVAAPAPQAPQSHPPRQTESDVRPIVVQPRHRLFASIRRHFARTPAKEDNTVENDTAEPDKTEIESTVEPAAPKPTPRSSRTRTQRNTKKHPSMIDSLFRR